MTDGVFELWNLAIVMIMHESMMKSIQHYSTLITTFIGIDVVAAIKQNIVTVTICTKHAKTKKIGGGYEEEEPIYWHALC